MYSIKFNMPLPINNHDLWRPIGDTFVHVIWGHGTKIPLGYCLLIFDYKSMELKVSSIRHQLSCFCAAPIKAPPILFRTSLDTVFYLLSHSELSGWPEKERLTTTTCRVHVTQLFHYY